MKKALLAVGVSLVSALNLAAQWLPTPTPPETDPINRTGNVVIGGPPAFCCTKLTVAAASDARFDVASQMAGYAAVRIISNNSVYATIDACNGPYDPQTPYTIAKTLVLQPNGGDNRSGARTTPAPAPPRSRPVNNESSFCRRTPRPPERWAKP